MRKIVFLLTLALALAAGAGAARAQETDPPPAAVWQFYRGGANEFSAEFPNLPKSSRIVDAATKQDLGALYKAYFDRTFYFVAACRSTACPQFEVVKRLKFRMRLAAGSAFYEKTLESGALETGFADAEGFTHRVRQIRAADFYFIVHTVTENADRAATDRFLDSFRAGAPAAGSEALAIDRDAYEKPLADEPFDPVAATPKKPAEPEKTPPPSGKTLPEVPLSIVGKPRADYTDAARAYEISGQVVVRVTFLANKTTTGAAPLRKLPFGLTEQALAAAALLAFEPALRDGKPVATTRPVVYTFTID